MAARILTFVRAFIVLCACSGAFVQSAFPTADEFDFAYYTTEVQVVDVIQAASLYATEYYDKIEQRGAVKVTFQGDLLQVYYDNSTYQIIDVVENNCTVWDEDISEYEYFPIEFGWLNKDPLVIGPSAPLWYAQSRLKEIETQPSETVRNIFCDKYRLLVKNKLESLTIDYYFAPEDWTTPYQFEKMRVPIRIHIYGNSSRFVPNNSDFVAVNQMNDFAYFSPLIRHRNDLNPPVGLGCRFKKETDNFPKIPKVFHYSAEYADLLKKEKDFELEINFERVDYDYPHRLVRVDRYSKLLGFRSTLLDFNTGVMYNRLRGGSCNMELLRDTDYQLRDENDNMMSRMADPAEALFLKGSFYEMGKRYIRGIRCDSYEAAYFDTIFMGKKYYKLVVTVYFTESSTKIGVEGVTESRIPVYYLVTGYSSPKEKTLQVQYNVFEFKDKIWPPMYDSFRLERCFEKENSKVYFIIILQVGAKDAAYMEDQDEIVILKLRSIIARHAKIMEMRIPHLKADYTEKGVFVSGVMLERPPATLQFFEVDKGPTTTTDPKLKSLKDVENIEQCSYRCVDEKDFVCKGYYFCGQSCHLKSVSWTKEPGTKAKDLGECTEYYRAELQSNNTGEAYLEDALGNLEQALLYGNVSITFDIPGAKEKVKIQDLIIGDGPFIGTDAGDKPYTLSIEWRKLDIGLQTTTKTEYAGSIHDCYKLCKAAGSLCSSFSFCPDAITDDKECMISSTLSIKGVTKDSEFVPDQSCNVYNLKFSEYFTAYPERVSLLSGDKQVKDVRALEKCAEICRLEKDFLCRGFEFCRSDKICTLHKKHILDLHTGDSSNSNCIHYAAKYIADYMDLGKTLIDDTSDVRLDTTLEECAKICSEAQKENCKSFNYCPSVDFSQSSCQLSTKLLKDDGVKTSDKEGCLHYEKRDVVHDWDSSTKKLTASDGYTKKGFTGLVVGMLFLGVVIGALAFVLYSYIRSKSSGEGMAVRFMKNES